LIKETRNLGISETLKVLVHVTGTFYLRSIDIAKIFELPIAETFSGEAFAASVW